MRDTDGSCGDTLRDKKRLRREFLQLRRGLAPELCRGKSARIQALVLSFAAYREAKRVMCYASMADEVLTGELMKRILADGKRLYLPYVREQAAGIMEAAEAQDAAGLVPGAFGILTVPAPKRRVVDPASIDLIFVPGVAFDMNGRRLGMGAGFYDRFLTRAPQAVLAALAFSCQLTNRLPAAPHDRQMHYILTEEAVIDCRQSDK